MRNQQNVTDFASATMMRLIVAGLAKQDINPDISPPSGAHVPYLEKRTILDSVLSIHGAGTILAIADAARDLPPEPVAQALLQARDVDDLLVRWKRLERFSHFRHFVNVELVGTGIYRLTHSARDDGPPPTRAESLLVLGLLVVMAEIIGSKQVRLASGSGEILRHKSKWCEPVENVETEGMILSAMPGSDTKSDPRMFSDDLVTELRQRISTDPIRRWALSELACETGMSERTLQRRLTEQSTSFSRIISDARLEVAASYLCDADGPGLAEIGFLSGYSDQAHFTRSFSGAVGTSPGSYRVDFGR